MFEVLRVILIVLLSVVAASAQTTTQPVVHVRDTDKQSDTSTVVSSGQILSINQLPAHWTLDFNFGKSVKAVFRVDGQPGQEYWASPYCPVGHNTPLVIAIGTHSIAVTVNGVAIPPTTFSLANASPATQPSIASWGFNWYSASAPAKTNAGVVPQILRLADDTNARWVRVWFEWNGFNANPSHYFDCCDEMRKSGLKVWLQLQYNDNNLNAFSAAQFAKIATACIGHIDALSMGNEIGSAGYLNQGQQALLAAAQPAIGKIVHPSILLIGPSYLNDSNLVKTKAYFAMPGGSDCDGEDSHFYYTHAPQIISGSLAFVSWSGTVKKSAWISEEGTRPYRDGNQNPATFPVDAWMADQAAMIDGQKSFNATIMIFSAFQLGDNLDCAFPLTGVLAKTGYYAGYQNALAPK